MLNRPRFRFPMSINNFFRLTLFFTLLSLSATICASQSIRIAFFPGGAPNGSFANIVYNGAREAERQLGITVDYYWSDWNEELMLLQFGKAIETNPDGIAIMGHPGDRPYKYLIRKAIEKGIIVTSQNVPLPYHENKFKNAGFGYVGQDLFISGETLGNAAALKAELKKNDRVAVWGFLELESRGQRSRGLMSALEKKHLNVDYIGIDEESNADPSTLIDQVESYIRAHPDVKMIIFDHGESTAMTEHYLKAAGKEPGEIFVGGFDLSPATIKAIEDGWLGVVLDQQPFFQGYLPILQIYLTKRYGFSGMHIDTSASLIDKGNILIIKDLAQKGIR